MHHEDALLNTMESSKLSWTRVYETEVVPLPLLVLAACAFLSFILTRYSLSRPETAFRLRICCRCCCCCDCYVNTPSGLVSVDCASPWKAHGYSNGHPERGAPHTLFIQYASLVPVPVEDASSSIEQGVAYAHDCTHRTTSGSNFGSVRLRRKGKGS